MILTLEIIAAAFLFEDLFDESSPNVHTPNDVSLPWHVADTNVLTSGLLRLLTPSCGRPLSATSSLLSGTSLRPRTSELLAKGLLYIVGTYYGQVARTNQMNDQLMKQGAHTDGGNCPVIPSIMIKSHYHNKLNGAIMQVSVLVEESHGCGV